MSLQIAFRTDASMQMGSGHVMRCLTLADALSARGAQCQFICREHPGHLMEVIRQRGYMVSSLLIRAQKVKADSKKKVSISQDRIKSQHANTPHAAWLGSSWQVDVKETASVLSSIKLDWLVVDHYALDHRWEAALAAYYHHLLVIDDLADRTHSCNLLLDQSLGRQPQDYAGLVPEYCKALIGPRYALLRPEFAALRTYSLHRRQARPDIRNLLITMGGVDQLNATGRVLQTLKTCILPPTCRITVVMGLTAPWLQDVWDLAAQMPWPTEVLVNVHDMAQRMADSDLAIGAAGSTSWERCCLGLPTLLVVLAENQQASARALDVCQAARLIGGISDIETQLPLAIRELIDIECRTLMSRSAAFITDGHGADKLLEVLGIANA